MKRIILAFIAAYLVSCMTDAGKDSANQPAPLGYSLGLGGQGMNLGGLQVTEILVGDLSGADTSFQGVLIFDTSDVLSVLIPDSLRIKYWDSPSFMAAIALRAAGSGYPRQRTSVTLPDFLLDVVDSCLTWDQSAFSESIPCLPIISIR